MRRDDELRMPRVGFDLLPQPGDVHVDRARGGHRVIAPDFVEELVARERGAAVFDEVLEQQELARGDLEGLPVARDFGPAEIDANVAERVAPAVDAGGYV